MMEPISQISVGSYGKVYKETDLSKNTLPLYLLFNPRTYLIMPEENTPIIAKAVFKRIPTFTYEKIEELEANGEEGDKNALFDTVYYVFQALEYADKHLLKNSTVWGDREKLRRVLLTIQNILFFKPHHKDLSLRCDRGCINKFDPKETKVPEEHKRIITTFLKRSDVSTLPPHEKEIFDRYYLINTEPSELEGRFNGFLDHIIDMIRCKEDPFKIAATILIEYGLIHPLINANGKTSRLFANALLIHMGKRAIIYDNQQNYLSAVTTNNVNVVATYLRVQEAETGLKQRSYRLPDGSIYKLFKEGLIENNRIRPEYFSKEMIMQLYRAFLAK